VSVSIQALSTKMVEVLEADTSLRAFRASIRGNSTYGLTEHCPMVPEVDDLGRFTVQDTYTPYLCVTNVAKELVAWDGESAFSNILLVRRVLGILNTERPTYENEADLKDFAILTFAVLTGDTMQAELKALGMKADLIVAGATNGLGPIPQAAFFWDVHLMVAGSGVMRG